MTDWDFGSLFWGGALTYKERSCLSMKLSAGALACPVRDVGSRAQGSRIPRQANPPCQLDFSFEQVLTVGGVPGRALNLARACTF